MLVADGKDVAEGMLVADGKDVAEGMLVADGKDVAGAHVVAGPGWTVAGVTGDWLAAWGAVPVLEGKVVAAATGAGSGAHFRALVTTHVNGWFAATSPIATWPAE